MPNPTLDQIGPTLPTRRYWFAILVGFPVAGGALLYAAFSAGAPFRLTALALLALEGPLLTRERTIRRMSGRRRAVWVVVGCITTAALVALEVSVFFFVALMKACSPDGC